MKIPTQLNEFLPFTINSIKQIYGFPTIQINQDSITLNSSEIKYTEIKKIYTWYGRDYMDRLKRHTFVIAELTNGAEITLQKQFGTFDTTLIDKIIQMNKSVEVDPKLKQYLIDRNIDKLQYSDQIFQSVKQDFKRIPIFILIAAIITAIIYILGNSN
jgi:hypothetical protein